MSCRAPGDYVNTARWAEALHRQYTDIDGLMWMSRQRDRDQALVLFDDRAASALAGVRTGGPLRTDDGLRQAIVNLALRVNIDVD